MLVAQTDLWQVIGSAGIVTSSTSGDLNLSATVGETAVGNGYDPVTSVQFISEGFQQGDDGPLPAPLEVSTFSGLSQCPDVHDGTLEIYPTGCKEPYTITLTGNGDTVEIEEIDVMGYTFTNLDSGDYRVTVRGVTLCTYEEFSRVDLKNDDCGVDIYSGITPNGDGKNDEWIIDNVEINQPNEVTIFSRWGQKVWQASNYDNESTVWTGLGQSGNTLPDGTYFYTIEVSGNASDSKSGWIQITR
jgi:gliding motility-associated-like protein